MRDSQGGKSKRHSCSDQRVRLCRLGRSSPITAHINGFEITCTCSGERCKSLCKQLRGESCSVSSRSRNWPSKVTDSRADQGVMTALQTQRRQRHYRMQLPASTVRVGEWLDSLAAKKTEKKTPPPPPTTTTKVCKDWGDDGRHKR